MYTVTYPHPPPGGGGERLEFEPSCVESTHKSAPYFGNIAEHLIIAAGDRKNSSRRRVLTWHILTVELDLSMTNFS